MASRGWGRRGRPRGASKAPPIFYQQAFAKVVGIAAAAIAQASTVGGQGDSSELQRFMTHHRPSFKGGGDPMVADHWFRQVERVLVAMGTTSDATRIRLSTFKLESESRCQAMTPMTPPTRHQTMTPPTRHPVSS